MENIYDKYLISFWNYYASNYQDEKMVDIMRDMGITVYMSPEHKVPEGLDNMKRVLKRCEELNMDCIVFDHRVTSRALGELGEEKYIENLKRVELDYGSFKSATSCFVFDEPNSENEYKLVYRARELMRKYFSRMRPFVSSNHIGMRNDIDGHRVMNDYMEKAKPEMLLYNCYSQCMIEENEKEQGLGNYFHNLKVFSDYSKKYNVPLMQSLVLSGHLCICSPTQEQLRWQLNVGCAHGVKGFFWFHPLELGYWSDPRGFAIDVDGNKTPKYDIVAYESKRFMRSVAPKLENYVLDKVYHYYAQYGEFQAWFDGRDEVISSVRNHYNRPLIVSRFVNKKDVNQQIVMIVNASQTDNSLVDIKIDTTNTHLQENFYLSPGSTKMFEVRI